MTPVSDPARELNSSRVFSAPREKVFKAYSDPSILAKWLGPKGFTNTFNIFEFKNGGRWVYTMHGPTGDYYNESVFHEIVDQEKIVYEHLRDVHHFWVTITFARQGEGTLLSWRMLFDDARVLDKIRKFLENANQENFDKLEGVLT